MGRGGRLLGGVLSFFFFFFGLSLVGVVFARLVECEADGCSLVASAGLDTVRAKSAAKGGWERGRRGGYWRGEDAADPDGRGRAVVF